MEQSLLDWLQNYGYIGIFFFLALGIVGLPLPDEIAMTFIGYLVSVGQFSLIPAYVSSLLGSLCGITVSYFLGKTLGYPFIRRYGGKFFITERRFHASQRLFRKYGNWLLFFGYFIPGVRHVTAYLAGIANLPYARFSIFAYSGAIVWCGTFITLGYTLGENWEGVSESFHRYSLHLLWVAIPLILIWLIRFWRRNQIKTIDMK